MENSSQVTVHPKAHRPNDCYEYEKSKGRFDNLQKIEDESILISKTGPAGRVVRFVCISDTHSKIKNADHLPNGDVLIHAGDFTGLSGEKEIQEFNDFLERVKHKYKYVLVIAGNHEISFDETTWNKGGTLMSLVKIYFLQSPFSNMLTPQQSKSLLKNCQYIQDEVVEILGIKIYGSPWQPTHFNLAFNLNRGQELLEKWNKIPDDVDILITHGPPLGIGDLVKGKQRVGCSELLMTIQERVRPKYHIFGHIHEDYGVWNDGKTTFINASTCDINCNPVNSPVVFDYIIDM